MPYGIVTPAGYMPSDDEARERHAKHRVGSTVKLEATAPRNLKFHKKYMALIGLAFDAWEPDASMQYKGQELHKSRERFRKDAQIMAGFYEPTWNLRGELRLESKSIAFGNMDEAEFERVYSAVLDVLIRMVLAKRGYTRESVGVIVDQLAEFA